MIDLQSNELKPDDDDRLSGNRGGDRVSGNSRRYMMIILGIIVLVLLIVLVTSMLTSNTLKSPNQRGNAVPINLPGQSTSSSQPRPEHPAEIQVPLISDTPTQAQVTPTDGLKRIEIPGEIVDSLNELEQTATTSGTSAATANPAPVGNTTEAATGNNSTQTPTTPATGRNASDANSLAALKGLPASNVTVQLSAASRSDSLAAFAKKHKLTNYWIYETRRNGNPWYVLITGSYPNTAAANKAIATLPEEVRSYKPWVKSIRQIHKEMDQR